jgi:hypothetical protein
MESIVQHPLFGPIAWNAAMEQWYGSVSLDVFASYDMAASALLEQRPGLPTGGTTRLPDRPVGVFELALIGPNPTKPSSSQEKAFRDLIENRGAIGRVVIDAIFDFYRSNWGYWRTVADPTSNALNSDDLLIPEIAAPEDLKSLITLLTLSVLDVQGYNPAILGFCFACTWDPEHGLGVLTHRGKVILVGENEITWSLLAAGSGRRPDSVTPDRIAIQSGMAAVKKLGGTVTVEGSEDGKPILRVDLLRNKQLNDADLLALGRFPFLHQLQLGSDQVTDLGLEALKPFTMLRLLDLTGARITDSGLKAFRGFTDLKSLHLSGTSVTDAGLTELRELPQLQWLFLNGTNVTDAGLPHIRALAGLKHLGLGGTRVTDPGLLALKELRSLMNLDLHNTQVSDAGVAALKEFKSLRYLDLARCHITDAGLEHLKGLKTLRTLNLMATATTDAGVTALQQALPGLQIKRSSES